MRRFVLAFAAGIVFTCSVHASDVKFDSNLARAAAEIAASRMGDLRGGFGLGRLPSFVAEMPSAPPTGIAEDELRPGVWRDGLAIAVERKSTASPEL